ncbi:hypothetical protein L9F63_007951, partial [Diploptera punctata]
IFVVSTVVLNLKCNVQIQIRLTDYSKPQLALVQSIKTGWLKATRTLILVVGAGVCFFCVLINGKSIYAASGERSAMLVEGVLSILTCCLRGFALSNSVLMTPRLLRILGHLSPLAAYIDFLVRVLPLSELLSINSELLLLFFELFGLSLYMCLPLSQLPLLTVFHEGLSLSLPLPTLLLMHLWEASFGSVIANSGYG